MNAKWQAWYKVLLHNKGTKALSLVLASITWYAIQPAISFETVVSDVPVRVLVDPGWAVLEQSVGAVDVHFRGSREGIRYLSQEQLEITADIRDMPYEESITVPLLLRDVRSIAGVRPVFLRPSEVVLTVDQEMDRKVPVRVTIQGSPPEGYEVEAYLASPQEVTVSGPRLRLEQIDAIRTVPIDLEGRLQSFRLRVGLVSPSRTWAARIEPERVDVEIAIVERAATTVFEDIRVKSLHGSTVWPEVDIRPSHVTIEVVGRSELLEALSPRDVHVFVETTGLEENVTEERALRVQLPPRIRVERMTPPEVSVTVRAGEHK